MSDSRKCYSDEDLSTAPWSFFSSFTILLFFLYPLNDVRKSLKVLIELLHIQLITSQNSHLVTCPPLIYAAPLIYAMFLAIYAGVFSVYFITSLTSEYLPVYNLDK